MSIRLRLALFYTLGVSLPLLLFGLSFYVILDRAITDDIHNQLNDRAAQVQHNISIQQDRFTGQINAVVPQADNLSGADVFVEIYRADGDILSSSTNISGTTLPITSDEFNNALHGMTNERTTLLGNTDIEIRTQPLYLPGTQTIVGVVQVAASLTHVEATLGAGRRALIAGIPLAVLISFLGGWLLTTSALRPIDNITKTAASIATTSDLTQRLRLRKTKDEVGRLTATFNSMLDRLQAAFQTQQRFVADSSHELRTPLTVIRGNATLLRLGDEENRAESINAIEKEAERMGRLIDDLLTLANLDARAELRHLPVELDTIVLDVFRQAKVLAGEREVRLLHVDAAKVNGDPDRLHQIVLNLVENAIKYTPVPGMITLELATYNNLVRLSICDTGIGIPEDQLPHIFDRFYRVDQARNRTSGGSGLGLAIVKSIIEAHNGRIEVSSKFNEGSCFTVWLPLIDR